MEKSPGAFRTISEVAEELDVPQHVLRFWETRFTHVKPLKRGGGRRYYRPDDVDLLKGIRHLLYGEGYTIRGVQRILKAEGVRFVQAIGRGEDVLSSSPAALGAQEIDEEAGEGVIAFSESEGEAVEAPPLLSDRDLQLLHQALAELREAARVLAAAGIADGRDAIQEF